MVNSNSFNTIFSALSDPTRREMIARLSNRGRMSVAELSEPFPVSKPAITKHIKKLEQAGLLTRHIDGRIHYCELRPEPLEQVASWVDFYVPFWNKKLNQLETHLAESPELGSEPDAKSDTGSQPARKTSHQSGKNI